MALYDAFISYSHAKGKPIAAALQRLSTAADPLQARAALREALAIVEALARERKLTPEQQPWPQGLRDALTKLPPEAAKGR
jgi:hypothetical protein